MCVKPVSRIMKAQNAAAIYVEIHIRNISPVPASCQLGEGKNEGECGMLMDHFNSVRKGAYERGWCMRFIELVLTTETQFHIQRTHSKRRMYKLNIPNGIAR